MIALKQTKLAQYSIFIPPVIHSINNKSGAKYSRMDQVKFVKDNT